MRVRIRLGAGPRVRRASGKNRHLAGAMSALLAPAALMAAALAAWSVAADLGLAGTFGISEGVFSHWQVWLAIAAALEGLSIVLHRYAFAVLAPEEAEEKSMRAGSRW